MEPHHDISFASFVFAALTATFASIKTEQRTTVKFAGATRPKTDL